MNSDFFTDLMKDTEFRVASVGSLMHSRNKVSTPLYVLNCIYGGGIPLGILSEISGAPGSGKSTFLYQCMGNYQAEYPNGVPVIYDMEASMDNARLKTLGVDTDKVLRLPAASMESAFSNMFKMLNKISTLKEKMKDISSFQIYDSISAGGTEKQHQAVGKGESAFGAGTIMEPQRIIKQNLSNVLPYMEEFPVFVGLINQVFTQINSYGGASLGSGGGMGLKHLCHSHIQFGKPSDNVNSKGFTIGTVSEVDLKKSKLSPKIAGIPCYIDVTNGGKIDEIESFFRYMVKLEFISTGSWYKFSKQIQDSLATRFPQIVDNSELNTLIGKNIRQGDMRELVKSDPDLLNLLQVGLIEYIDNIYPAQREINEAYENSLIPNCRFLKDIEKIDVDESTGEIISENN